MFVRYVATVLSLSTCFSVASAQSPQAPQIVNGQVSTRQVPSGLAETFRSIVAAAPDVVWIGYAVPARNSGPVMCCWTDGTSHFSGSMSADEAPCCGSCRLEPQTSGSGPVRTGPATAAGGQTVKLEGPDRVLVLFRIADRQVERIRSYSEGCTLDAGGRSVHWFDGVRPAESIALLESFLGTSSERKNRITNGALAAIAEHAEPAAGAALERLATSHATPDIRGDALFWLAQRGDTGAETIILNALDKDSAASVRKRAVFALAQLRDDRGVDSLIRTARSHQDAAVRGEAIFWLGQKAGRKAAGTITEAIEKDPETEVKRRAVFALSQLPKGEGVPLLIDVARKNSNPAVRKQAIFWLGQSKDPRAIEFFAEILK
jgi:hypothetical protein